MTNNTEQQAVPVAQEVKDDRLWCLHVTGMDDVHPAPDRATAQLWATQFTVDQQRRHPSPHPYDPVMNFTVAEWPWSAERHAAGLAHSVEQNTWPVDPLGSYASTSQRSADNFNTAMKYTDGSRETLPCKSGEGAGDREAIARIIDPGAWMDHAQFSRKAQQDAERSRVADWLDAAEKAVAPSLAKADRILALTPDTTQTREAEEERAAVAIAKVLGIDLQEACGSTDEGPCDSDTCPGALTEDHDTEEHRERIYRMARAALNARGGA